MLPRLSVPRLKSLAPNRQHILANGQSDNLALALPQDPQFAAFEPYVPDRLPTIGPWNRADDMSNVMFAIGIKS